MLYWLRDCSLPTRPSLSCGGWLSLGGWLDGCNEVEDERDIRSASHPTTASHRTTTKAAFAGCRRAANSEQ